MKRRCVKKHELNRFIQTSLCHAHAEQFDVKDVFFFLSSTFNEPCGYMKHTETVGSKLEEAAAQCWTSSLFRDPQANTAHQWVRAAVNHSCG